MILDDAGVQGPKPRHDSPPPPAQVPLQHLPESQAFPCGCSGILQPKGDSVGSSGPSQRVCVSIQSVQPFATSWTLGPPATLLCPWASPGKNAGVDSHSLLQGTFPTQGSNLQSPALADQFFTLSHQEAPLRSASGKLYFQVEH